MWVWISAKLGWESGDLVWRSPELFLTGSASRLARWAPASGRLRRFVIYTSAALTGCGRECQCAAGLRADRLWPWFWNSGGSFSPSTYKSLFKNIFILHSATLSYIEAGLCLGAFDKRPLCSLSYRSAVSPIFHMTDQWGSPSLLCSKAW